ncbi:hypothetical protein ACFVRU_58140, partial [Streptomyces sp. NPDC057927]
GPHGGTQVLAPQGAVGEIVGKAKGGPSATDVAACALCCALWLSFLALAHRRIRVLATSSTDGPPALTPRHATAATLCTVALAVCAVALVF